MAAREALEAEEAAREADRAMKHALVRQVRYFSEFSAGERKALCEAMRRVDARAGERVMTHLPRLERESRANSAAGKTSAKTFQRALFRATQAKKNAKEKTKQEETAFASHLRRDDAWYVVAAGAVDVHVSVPGDAHGDIYNLAGSVSEDADPLGSSRSRSRAKWRGAFSKVKRRVGGEERDAKSAARLPPRAATLRAGAFFGALDDAFAADPNATVVFVAAEPTTVLFAVPGERFATEKPREDEKEKAPSRERARSSRP